MKIGKKGKEIKSKFISYKLKVIDSTRFMASSLSDLVDKIFKETHKAKRKYART